MFIIKFIVFMAKEQQELEELINIKDLEMVKQEFYKIEDPKSAVTPITKNKDTSKTSSTC